MKQLHIILLLNLLMSMVGSRTFAYNCKVDGICYDLNSSNLTATVTYSGYPYNNDYTGHYNTSISGKDIVIPSTITYNNVEYTVTAVDNYAFYDCGSEVLMSSVTLPSTITKIGKQAFWRCTALTSFTIPRNVTSIAESAFYGCSGLTSITSEIEEPFAFGSWAFDGISSQCVLTVPYGTRDAYIAAGWTEDIFIGGINEYSPNITFADANVKVLCVANWDTNGDGELSEDEAAAVTDLSEVFKYSTSISSFNELQFFTGLKTIGDGAFYNCKGLTSIVIPDGVTTIGNSAFFGCEKMATITLPQSIELIGTMAFYMHGWDNSMTSVYITDLKSWCSIVFSEIESNPIAYGGHLILNGEEIQELVIPDGVTSIKDNAFYAYYNLTSVTIPSCVISIGKYSFRYCHQITSLNISEGVEAIGYCAFEGCSGLTSVTIPSSVTSIGSYSFSGCSSLSSVIVEMTTPITITSSTFSNRTNATLFVPSGSRDAYLAADYWKEFKEIVEMEDDEPEEIEVTDISQMENVIYIEPTEAISGTQTVLSVKMKNNVAIQTIQFDLYLPEGVTVVANEDDELITASKERIKKFNYFNSTMQSNGALRLLAQATTTNVPAGDGEICRVTVSVPESMDKGDYPIIFKDILMVEANNTSHSPDPNVVQCKLTVLPYTPGDANNDGEINAIDFNMIGNYILGNHSQANFSFRAADFNNDGDVNAIDFNMVGNYILYGSSAPSRAARGKETLDPQ